MPCAARWESTRLYNKAFFVSADRGRPSVNHLNSFWCSHTRKIQNLPLMLQEIYIVRPCLVAQPYYIMCYMLLILNGSETSCIHVLLPQLQQRILKKRYSGEEACLGFAITYTLTATLRHGSYSPCWLYLCRIMEKYSNSSRPLHDVYGLGWFKKLQRHNNAKKYTEGVPRPLELPSHCWSNLT